MSALPCLTLMSSLKTIILKYIPIPACSADSCPLAAVRWESQPATPSVYAAFRGSPSLPFAGDHAVVRGSPTPPFVGDHAAVRGESQPTVRGHSARRRLWLPPARRLPPLSGLASRLPPLLSSLPVMVSPASCRRIDKPAGRGHY